MKFIVMIPARFGSTRLPGKPLEDVNGKPLIEHVYRRATESHADAVYIATDDFKIRHACEGFSAKVCMTRADHASGTDRIAEAIEELQLGDDDIVVNLQGDEPLMPPENINLVAELLDTHPQAHMATLSVPIYTPEEFRDPNVVKVVSSGKGQALYFSRATIPFNRDEGANQSGELAERHLGIYAYRAVALRALVKHPVTDLETLESLEQLRALYAGFTIQITRAEAVPGPSVDTAEDLAKVREILKNGSN